MREITPQKLWLGHAADVRGIRRLHDAGVAAVVDLAYEEPCAQLPRDIAYCRFPLIDGDGNPPRLLLTAIATTASLIQDEVPTMVACGVGMSRSPSILAVSLAIVRGTSPSDCLQQLTAGQPRDISPRLWADAVRAYNELAS